MWCQIRKDQRMKGRVFLYKFGKKIFDKIMEAMKPEFSDETPINPFDMWKGAHFKLKIRKVDGYWNYDKSEFADPVELLDSDEEREKVYNSTHKLKPFHDPSNFKTYDELKEKMERVLRGSSDNRTAEQISQDVEDSFSYDSIKQFKDEEMSSKPEKENTSDTMAYFEKLATS